ncbi:MAG TPA: hypothetical protein PKH79_08490, partial [Prolixibacteraceae bacterium]|nr:hypothetical protein [Prolixibacteraceae bacterium]
MAQDVFANPNFYLKAISISIFLLQIFLLLAIGLVAQKREIPIGQIFLLQSGFLFNDVVIWLFSRVNPDVFFVIVTTLFILIYLKFGYKEYSSRKFAIWGGVVMGLGFATKFNYLPILILPFIFIH